MPQASIAVVGAGLAGLRACEGLRAQGFDGRITLVGDEPHLPYDRPPLSKQFLAGEWDLDRVMLTSPEQIAGLGLDLRIGPEHRAVSLDLDARRLALASGESVGYDGLVLATGSAARRLPDVNGLPGVHVLRTLDDAVALREVLSRPGARLALAGAGFIGLEVAATARRLGAQVTVVEPLEVPLGRVLGPMLGRACEAMHREEGVSFHLGTVVESVGAGSERASQPPGTGELSCRLSNGQVLEVDALLVGIGAAPSVGFLEGSGLAAGPDGIVCDRSLTAGPGVVVAGDVARWPAPGWRVQAAGEETAPSVRVEHRTNAAEQGEVAATSLLAYLGLGTPGTPGTPGTAGSPGADTATQAHELPYVWSDQYGVKIQVLGMPRSDDEVIIVEGSPAERRFLALYGRGGRVQAAVGFSRPRHVMMVRPLLERGATLSEARALFS